MKTRIIGSIIILFVVVCLFVISENGTETPITTTIKPSSANDAAMKSLSIN